MPEHDIKLIGKVTRVVMAPSLRVGAINHSNGSLEAVGLKSGESSGDRVCEIEQEIGAGARNRVEDIFNAVLYYCIIIQLKNTT